MKNKPITQAQVDYVVAHIDDRPRTAVARAAGMSMTTLYRIVRRHGGAMCPERSRRNPEHAEIVRRCYPVMTTREIADRYGINYGRVNKIARDLGVSHGPEVRERMRAENAERVRASRSKIDFAASAAKRKRKRRYDELRVMSGLEPLTRLPVKTMPYKAYKAKWHLCRRYGYMEAEGDPYALLYDEQTRRMDEGFYERKYKLRFQRV